jgi:threonine aldolase
MIDLRSDTVTRPGPEMRAAMAQAEVGDDVFGEDPTVQRLEARIADILGKEAALFVPSGVMGNQIALMLHCERGDEVILAEQSHIFYYESGAPAVLAGVQLRPVGPPSGILTPDDVEAAVRGGHDWEPRSRLVCLENTVNRAGGAVYPSPLAEAVASGARRLGLKVHLDGARLWNAAVATGTPERELARPFDTVNVCLSKGLGAPAGSALAGGADAIRRARRLRKLLGGGMRQVGILAAAGSTPSTTTAPIWPQTTAAPAPSPRPSPPRTHSNWTHRRCRRTSWSPAPSAAPLAPSWPGWRRPGWRWSRSDRTPFG